MSVGEARESYKRDFASDNPASPVNIYRDNQSVEIKVKSISFLETGLAQVRFIATVRGTGDEAPKHRHWISTVAYHYEPDVQIPLSALSDNALGFAVTDYRAEPEDASQ